MKNGNETYLNKHNRAESQDLDKVNSRYDVILDDSVT